MFLHRKKNKKWRIIDQICFGDIPRKKQKIFDRHRIRTRAVILKSWALTSCAPARVFLVDICFLQVAGGMRFLENNLLCHRHLRAANVCVYAEHLNSLAVKITDYMVPYARNDQEFVDEVDLTEMEWPWLAPDSLRNRAFDIITDVWAYGCFLFEVGTGLGLVGRRKRDSFDHF